MKKLFLLTIISLLLVSSVSAALTDSLVSYYKFDGDLIDELGFNNGTDSGVSAGTGFFNADYYANGNSQDILVSNDWTTPNTNFSVSFWFKPIAQSGRYMPLIAQADNYGSGDWILTYYDGGNWRLQKYTGTGSTAEYYVITKAVTDNEWHHIVAVYDHVASDFYIYVNGNVSSDTTLTTDGLDMGKAKGFFDVATSGDNTAWYSSAHIDEIGIWDRSLESSEVDSLYNGGSGLAYPFIEGPVANVSSLNVIKFPLNLSSKFVSENSSITYHLYITTEYYNLTDTDAVYYYDGEYYTPTIDEEFYSYEVSSVNYSVTVNAPFVDVNNTIINTNWYYNITINDTKTNYSYGLDTSPILWAFPRVNISVNNAFSSMQILNFTGNITTTSGFYDSFNVTNGQAIIRLDNFPENYSVYVEADGYAIANDTNYKTLNINNASNLTIRPLNFGLYSSNSVYITIRKESDSTLISEYVALTVTGNSSEVLYNTTNGTIFLSGLSDGVYSFKFNSDNYTQRVYTVTVADRSFQNLAAYLTAATNTVTFTVSDFNSGATLEGTSMTMSRLLNTTYQTIESKVTDITGRAQFTYTEGIKYRFYITLPGYTSKTFDLDPVIFSSYSVRINKIVSLNFSMQYTGVMVDFSPKKFYNDAQNNLTFYFASPTGLYETYGYNITYPGGSVENSGSNALGENLNAYFNISSAGLFDVVTITINYDITTDEARQQVYIYNIYGASSYGNNTFSDNLNETYGLGIFERLLISTIVMLIVIGIVTLLAGAIPGLLLGLLGYGILTFLGFIPVWVMSIVGLGGFILLIKYS